jgi:hypothetical protein
MESPNDHWRWVCARSWGFQFLKGAIDMGALLDRLGNVNVVSVPQRGTPKRSAISCISFCFIRININFCGYSKYHHPSYSFSTSI